MSHEKKSLVKTYQIRLFCDCGGEMLPTGMCLTSYPPQYPHVCNQCKKSETVHDCIYPKIVHEAE